MSSVAIPASLGTADQQAEQATSAVDASLVAVPDIRLPVDARGLALGILAALASVLALWWAQAFLVPLLLGIIISYTLNPLVAWLEHLKIPRVIGTLIVMTSVLCALALGTYSLRGQMQTMIEQLPEAATKVSGVFTRMQGSHGGNIQKMQTAAAAVEKATAQATGGSTTARQPATHVVVDQPPFRLGSLMWSNSMGALGAMGQAAMVVFLVFFLLVAGASLAIATLVGTFVTTWMVGRIAHMNSAAVFISLLFWGWLWGVWGMLLSIPIIVIVKVVSQHVEQLHPMAELLGD
jgi:predicted PurR-regulated permease PerM